MVHSIARNDTDLQTSYQFIDKKRETILQNKIIGSYFLVSLSSASRERREQRGPASSGRLMRRAANGSNKARCLLTVSCGEQQGSDFEPV